jgi:hypothetical protein
VIGGKYEQLLRNFAAKNKQKAINICWLVFLKYGQGNMTSRPDDIEYVLVVNGKDMAETGQPFVGLSAKNPSDPKADPSVTPWQ